MSLFDFLTDYDPIIDGPVEIRFEKSGEFVKVTYIVDFGKTNLASHQAANIQKAIVAILRTGLNVSLSKCR